MTSRRQYAIRGISHIPKEAIFEATTSGKSHSFDFAQDRPFDLPHLCPLSPGPRGEDLGEYRLNPDEFSLAPAQSAGLESAIRNRKWSDVPGLCKVATLKEIEAQGWSLNPGRYVGVSVRPPDDFDFAEKLEELNEELKTLNVEAQELEERIAANVTKLLEAK